MSRIAVRARGNCDADVRVVEQVSIIRQAIEQVIKWYPHTHVFTCTSLLQKYVSIMEPIYDSTC